MLANQRSMKIQIQKLQAENKIIRDSSSKMTMKIADKDEQLKSLKIEKSRLEKSLDYQISINEESTSDVISMKGASGRVTPEATKCILDLLSYSVSSKQLDPVVLLRNIAVKKSTMYQWFQQSMISASEVWL